MGKYNKYLGKLSYLLLATMLTIFGLSTFLQETLVGRLTPSTQHHEKEALEHILIALFNQVRTI